MEAVKTRQRFTYADYAKWETDERFELIDGVPLAMAAPSRKHQGISMELGGQLHSFLKGKPGKVYAAPFDVRLNGAGDDDDTVVQPDLVVICDESKLDDKGCNGVPDLIVEILSPSDQRRDKVLKFNKYLQAGVREYWIVDPAGQTVDVHILEDGRYYTTAYTDTDTAPVHVLNGCGVTLADVFA